MDWLVPLSDLDFGAEEKEAVQRVMDRGWLAMGEITQQFEEAFSGMVGVKHSIAVTNGTASLHLACRALGIGPGDEVIVPSLTFVATANAILYVGATPVFADITSEDNLNISVEDIERKISPRTRAIMVMHYGGYACDMPAIMELANHYGLYVIEDAAHAPGADIEGRRIGTWGHIASFSFFPNKNMTTAEGGMLTTNDDVLARSMRTLRSHGMTTLTWDRHQGHAWSYDVVDLGYNYRIDEIRSAIGIEQLKKLLHNNQRRKEITRLYRQAFEHSVPQLQLPFKDHHWTAAYHIMPVLLPKGVDRLRFAEIMKAHRVQTSLHYPPIHLFQYYREQKFASPGSLPLTESVADREVTLPLYAALQHAQVEIVVSAVQGALKEAHESARSASITAD